MIIKYFSEDGREFNTEDGCKYYESMLEQIRVTSLDKVRQVEIPIGGDATKMARWYVLQNPVDLYHYEVMLMGVDVIPYDVMRLVETKNITFPLIMSPSFGGSSRKSIDRERGEVFHRINALNTELEGLLNYFGELEEFERMFNPTKFEEPPTEIEDVTVEEPETDEPEQTEE